MTPTTITQYTEGLNGYVLGTPTILDLARSGIASVLTQYQGYVPSRINDGDEATSGIGYGWFQIELPAEEQIGLARVDIWQWSGVVAKLQYLSAQNVWTDVPNGGLLGTAYTQVSMNPSIRSRYWRVLDTNNAGLQIGTFSLFRAGTSVPAATGDPGSVVATPQTYTQHAEDAGTGDDTLANRIGGFFLDLGKSMTSGFTWLGKYTENAITTLRNSLVANLGSIFDLMRLGFQGTIENLGRLLGALQTGLTWLGEYLAHALQVMGAGLLAGLQALGLVLGQVLQTSTNVFGRLGDIALSILDLPAAIWNLATATLSDLFIPSANAWTTTRSNFDSGIGNLVGRPVDVLTGSWEALQPTSSADCEGPFVTMPAAVGGWTFHPLKACDGPMNTARNMIRPILLAITWVFCIKAVYEIFMGAFFGERTRTYSADPNTLYADQAPNSLETIR